MKAGAWWLLPRAEHYTAGNSVTLSHTDGFLAGLQQMRTLSSPQKVVLRRMGAVTQCSQRPVTPTTATGQVRPSPLEATSHPAAFCRSWPRQAEEGLRGEPGASSHRQPEHRHGTEPPPALPTPVARPQRTASPGNLRPNFPRPGSDALSEKPFKKALTKKSGRKRQVAHLSPGSSCPPTPAETRHRRTPGKDRGTPAPPRPQADAAALPRLSGRGGAGRAGPAGEAAATSSRPPVPAQAAVAHTAKLLLRDNVGEGLGPVKQLAAPHPPAGAETAALARAEEPLQRRRLHPTSRPRRHRERGAARPPPRDAALPPPF